MLCFWPPNFKRICYLVTPKELKMKLGWECLNKYLPLFHNSRFVLYTDCRDDNEIVDLTLVDKMKLIRIVKQHSKDFQVLLQNETMQPEDLLDHENLHRFLKNLNNNGLFGTILGFGRNNAWLYDNYYNQPDKRLMVSAWPEEELVNLDQLNQQTQAFQSWELSDLFYPRFACDPNSEETKQLKQTYREEREEIVKYFEGKDLVEATLSLFNQRLNACPAGR